MEEGEQQNQNENKPIESFAKYRIYVAIFFMIIAIYSIIPLFKRSEGDYRILFSVLMFLGFVAITTYIKKYYPYSVVPNLFFIGIMLKIQEDVEMYIALIPFVYFAALWYHNELGFTYPFSLSVVSGILLATMGNVDFLMGMFFLTIQAIVLSVIILLATRLSREANRYFYIFGTGTLSLIIFFITFVIFNEYGL